MKTYRILKKDKQANMMTLSDWEIKYDDRIIYLSINGFTRDMLYIRDRAGKTTELDKILKELEEKGYRKEVENEQVDTIRSSNDQRERS
jgi:Zn/Cd-binding protein ZinT